MPAAPARLSFTPCPANPTPRQLALAVNRAHAAWQALQARDVHPDGEFDDRRRWYPSPAERRDCCSSVRSPSAAWPFSLIKHCRSVEHVAARFAVPAALLRKRINRDRPRRPVVHADHYKAVAVVAGRYYSIYAGEEVEYRLGETLYQPARPDHEGGYYCYAAVREARAAAVPSHAELRDAPRAILRLQVGGRKIRYDGGKIAFSAVTPIAVVEEVDRG